MSERQVRDVYDQYDTNGDRELDYDEFAALLRASGNHTEEDIQATFDLYDHNGDGKISYNEFRQHIHHSRPPQNTHHRTSHTVYGRAPTHMTTSSHHHQTYSSRVHAPHHNYSLRTLFDQYDRNRDGFLDEHEMYEFYNGCGCRLDHHQVRTQLKYINGSDRVNFDEFQRFVRFTGR